MDISIAPTVNFAPVGVDRPVSSGALKAQASEGTTEPGSAGTKAAQTPPTSAELATALEKGNKALQTRSSAVEFQIDDKSHQSVVKVVDTQTQEVIRQIPSKEFLQIASSIDSYLVHLLHEKA